MKYSCINGWTKEKMSEVIKARPFERACVVDGSCLYLNDQGNKCAVGLFIPDGHYAQSYEGDYNNLKNKYPDLKEKMPLEDMMELQRVHDSYNDVNTLVTPWYGENYTAKSAMIKWVEENVDG